MQIKFKIFFLSAALVMHAVSGLFAQDRPPKPKINTASFDITTGYLHLDWNPVTSTPIDYYIIYSIDLSTFPVSGTKIDSVPASQTSYVDSLPGDTPKIYSVTAMDMNGTQSLLSGDYHRAPSAGLSFDSCSNSIIISWDKYLGWKSNLTGFRIRVNESEHEEGTHFSNTYVLKNASDTYKLEQNIIDTTKLSYILAEVKENMDYKIYIEAYDNQGNVSSSRIRAKYTYMPPPPAFLNLDYVSVLDDRTTEIAFTSELNGDINDFQLLRSKNESGPYVPALTIENVTTETTVITDNVVTQGEKYYYRVDALNSCYNPILSSNTGNNILLSGNVSGSQITLNWSEYRSFSGALDSYNLYRMNEYGEFIYLGSFSSSELSFSEDIRSAGNNRLKGEIEYYVEALESGVNPSGSIGISKSNVLKLEVGTTMYMPNAFSPNDDGQNDIFMPVFDFIPREYKMFIYDRSGKILFQSIDPQTGWDGYLSSRGIAPSGVYVYHIEYQSYNGIRQVDTGTVTLVNP